MSELNDPRLVRAARAADAVPPTIEWRPLMSRRLYVGIALVVLWVAAIEARLLYLQVYDRPFILEKAQQQQQAKFAILARRGDITDRSGRPLALSVDGEEVVADPSIISDGEVGQTAQAVCAALDSCTPADLAQLRDKLSKRTSRYQVLKRRASIGEASRAAQVPGVFVTMQSLRYYPNRELGANVLGWVNTDNEGMAGIEHAYEQEIGGRPGIMLQQRDRKGGALALQIKQPATDGANLQLTLDSYLQYIVERELHVAVKAADADGAVAIVMQPDTGEILAMASLPTFNPNNTSISRPEAESRRNRAVQDAYEYGSVVKVATAAAALEEHVFGLEDMFDVSAGQIQIGSRPPIRDVHTYGQLSFMDVVVKSSNVGIIKVALRLGEDRMDRYFRLFGFGTALSRDFPAERSGNVWPRAKLSPSAIASMAMGYQIGITPLQMTAAVNSVANGGELVEPRLVKGLEKDGQRTVVRRNVIRRTMSRRTAEHLRTMMEQVVDRGTARSARIEGYTIAAKTGTAAKVVGGRYSKQFYYASTVGFVPSTNPVATILVSVDSPRNGGYYGGTIAAPVFKRIAEATLRHLGVPSDEAPASRYLVADRSSSEPELTPVRVSAHQRASVAPATQGLMPDMTGASGREALRVLTELGLHVRLEGSGVVVTQSIQPGQPLERGASCVLWLARSAAVATAGGAP